MDHSYQKKGVTDHQQYIYVHQLFSRYTGNWDVNLIFNLFDSSTARFILNIFVHRSYEDKLIWTLENNDRFMVKSAYRKMFEEVHLKDLVGYIMKKIFKKLWKLPTIPRVNHFLWKCIKNILPTRDKLVNVIQDLDVACPFCSMVPEIPKHIILEYIVSKAVCSLFWVFNSIVFIPLRIGYVSGSTSCTQDLSQIRA